MKTVTKEYSGYTLKYYFQPGTWMTDIQIIELKKNLDYVNKESGKNFTYGIFTVNLTLAEIRKFLSETNLCIIIDMSEVVGFFYNVLLQRNPTAIHAGLVIITKNRGVDLIGIPYYYITIYQHKIYGNYYYTSISSTPYIIGLFSDCYSNAWPSYKANQLKPPTKEYRKIVESLHLNYIKLYFPEEHLEIDLKRFIMKSKSVSMGFENDMRKMSRYYKLQANLFCLYWIDYSKGEDLIQIGKVDMLCLIKIKLILCNISTKLWFKTIQMKISNWLKIK